MKKKYQKGRRRRRDQAFRPELQLKPECLPRELAKLIENPECSSVLANALKFRDVWVHYSRARAGYVPGTACHTAKFRLNRLVNAVDKLTELGLLEHCRTRPTPNPKWQSRIRASAYLLALVPDIPCHAFEWHLPELVLKNDEKQRIAFRENVITGRLRREVMEINRVTAGYSIEVDHPDADYRDGIILVGNQQFDPTRVFYTRSFRLNFMSGGRLCGCWWQNLPKSVRASITINGQKTVEIDIRNCHPRLLRALTGLPDLPPSEDAYRIPGVPRKIAKHAINMVLNCPNWRSATSALVQHILEVEHDWGTTAKEVMALLKKHRPNLKPGSGNWKRLQHLESNCCIAITKELMARGIPIISVHESFIVPEQFQSEAKELVEREFAQLCDRLRQSATKQRLKSLWQSRGQSGLV